MNIKNNIINYLDDNEYVIAQYEDKIYIYNYSNIKSYLSNTLEINLDDKHIIIKGNNLSIIKLTKKELIVKGKIEEISFLDD